ncbi:MAG: hypothetical protein KF838_12690 [Phycisphaeraceae bacterium]|nr:MAG: hypothetical protein KF838_12690 [Phycisphaeraceae bacterium]
MRRVSAAFGVCVALAWSVFSQCPGWLDLGERAGFGSVRALTTWQTALGESIVVVGEFREYNGQVFNGVGVRRDGTWHSLGQGLNGTVSTAAVFNGEIVVGGSFTASGATPLARIARWNGSSWQPLGSGFSGEVLRLVVFNDQLHAIGVIGGFVSRWSGSGWVAIGGGLNNVPRVATIHDGQLVVAGDFSLVGSVPALGAASWDGSVWSAVGNGLPLGVTALESIGGSLYACGVNSAVGRYVMRLEGSSWVPMVAGLEMIPRAIFGWNERVAIAGSSSGLESRSIQIWNGDSWEDGAIGEPISIAAALVTEEGLWIGGSFAGGVATLRDGSWLHERRAFDGEITAVGVYRGDLIVGGSFRLTPDGPTVGIARFDGHRFEPLGNGLLGTIATITEGGGVLYVGGSVRHETGAVFASNIVSWDGERWTTVSSADSSLAGMTEFRGEVYGAGSFSSGSGFSAAAKRTPTGWAVIPGLGSVTSGTAVTEWNGLLVVSGSFVQAGGQTVRGVAAWDGDGWLTLEEGLVGKVLDVATHNGELYAAVQTAYLGIPVGVIMRWDGDQWRQDYSSFGWLTESGGRLIAMSSIRSGPTVFTSLLERFADGWREVAPGIGTRTDVRGAFPYRDETVIVGGFQSFGPTGSRHLARWSPSGVAGFVVQPEDVAGYCARVDATFTALPSSGYGSIELVWHKDGEPLEDGAGPGGSVVTGSRTPTLTIANAGFAMAGEYECRVANECGVVWSDRVLLAVCASDHNCDGTIDILDVLEFIESFGECVGRDSPCAPYGIEMDLNGDGIIDILDLLDFMNEYGLGCG